MAIDARSSGQRQKVIRAKRARANRVKSPSPIGGSVPLCGGGAVAASVSLCALSPIKLGEMRWDPSPTSGPVVLTTQIKSALPLREVHLEGEGQRIPLSPAGSGYTADIPPNGRYLLTAVGNNGQQDSQKVTIDCIDTAGPQLLAIETCSARVWVTLQDDLAGAASITATYDPVDRDGDRLALSLPLGHYTLTARDQLGNLSSGELTVE